jgi:hypothetical protein
MRSCLHAASVAIAAAMLALLAAGPAAAECDTDNALFEDDFEFLDGTWGQPLDGFDVEDGVLVTKGNWGRVNLQTTNEAADICVDATITEAADIDNTSAWVVFWWQDWDNYYVVGYWGKGALQINRKVKGKFLDLSYIESVPALKAGIGQTNKLEIKTTSKDFIVLVNGTEATPRFKGKPPKGGAPVGLMAGEPEGKPATVTFDNLVVSAPAESP